MLRCFLACLFAASWSATLGAAERVEFNYRLPQVGQTSDHEVDFKLDLAIKLIQAGETVSTEQRQVDRAQHRQVEVLEVAGDRVMKVRARFPTARQAVAHDAQPPQPRSLPIEARSYLVERVGHELHVATLEGQAVAAEEKALVVSAMDSIGRPNQLGRFLHGRSVALGETLELPKEMAGDLLGVRESGGEAQSVRLTLRSVRDDAGRRLAEFDTRIAVKLGDQGTIDVGGPMTLDAHTCQVAEARFSGPVSARDLQIADGKTYDLHSDGTMTASVRSRYVRR